MPRILFSISNIIYDVNLFVTYFITHDANEIINIDAHFSRVWEKAIHSRISYGHAHVRDVICILTQYNLRR